VRHTVVMGTPLSDLGHFLRTRRDRLRPEDVGLAAYGRRRVPGLRREELAQLAGVSVDYYVRLEQGRDVRPSEAVLDALARALGLDEAERAHLHALGRAAGSRRPRRRPAPQRVRRGVLRLLETLGDVPAFVLGRHMRVLAHNALAGALLGHRAGANQLRLIFLDEGARDLFPDWEEVAAEAVGWLRLTSGELGDDADLCELVGELSLRSEDFRRLWAAHPVRRKTFGRKRMVHPLVGELTLDYETLVLPDPEQHLVVYSAADRPTRTALDLLSAVAAPGEPIPAAYR